MTSGGLKLILIYVVENKLSSKFNAMQGFLALLHLIGSKLITIFFRNLIEIGGNVTVVVLQNEILFFSKLEFCFIDL